MGLFSKAVKHEAKLRMALSGPSGSGKTYTSLVLATELARHGNSKIALVDTEYGSASKYADLFAFDVAEMSNFHPNNYVRAIQEAEAAGYDVVILDSITHAWTGKGGILDIVGGNFSKWKEVNPIEQAFIQAIISSKLHVIATMRAKTQYEVEKNERGKAEPRKVGMGAIQRDGIEYEFDITAMMDLENNMVIEKTRCPAIKGQRVNSPTAKFLAPVLEWLSAGAKPDPESVKPEPVKPTPKPEVKPARNVMPDPIGDMADSWVDEYGTPLDYDNPFTGNGLSKAAAGFLEKCRTYQTEDPKPCSEAMYRYLVGTVNYATEKDAHTAILSEMVGSLVDSENRPGYTLTKKLLDTLPATKQNKETKENEPNPEHVPAILAAVKEIWKATKAA